jgi:hypothetical protein
MNNLNVVGFGIGSWDVCVQADFDHQHCFNQVTKKAADDFSLFEYKRLERIWKDGSRPMESRLVRALPVFTQQDYQLVALRNFHQMSRTAMGIVDLSSSPKKTDSMNADFFGEFAKVTTETSQNLAVSYLYKNRFKIFSSPLQLRGFVEKLAKIVTKGAVKKGFLIRQHDSDRYPYTLVKDLEPAMRQFYTKLLKRMANKESPRVLAPWVEYRVNFTDHFFSDGCGKVSQLLATFLCMRSGHPPPLYRNRDEFYALNGNIRRGNNVNIDRHVLQRLTAYYQTFFMPYEVFKHANGPHQVKKALYLLKQRDARPLVSSDTGNTYSLRTQLLNSGADRVDNSVSSHHAYTYLFSDHQEFPGKNSSLLKIFLQNSLNWIPERRVEHERVTAEFLKSAEFLHQSIAKVRPNATKPFLLMMRGNSGSGKSYFLEKLLHSKLPTLNFPRVSNLSKLVLNPDLFKESLAQGSEVNIRWSQQLHNEASMLCWQLTVSLMKAKFNFVVDKRLASLRDVEKLLGIKEGEQSQRSHETLMIDIDAPLGLSLQTCQARDDRASQVRPPDHVIQSGFLAMRKGRKSIAHSNLLDVYYAFARRVNPETKTFNTFKVAFREKGDIHVNVLTKRFIVWKEMLRHKQEQFPGLYSAL